MNFFQICPGRPEPKIGLFWALRIGPRGSAVMDTAVDSWVVYPTIQAFSLSPSLLNSWVPVLPAHNRLSAHGICEYDGIGSSDSVTLRAILAFFEPLLSNACFSVPCGAQTCSPSGLSTLATRCGWR